MKKNNIQNLIESLQIYVPNLLDNIDNRQIVEFKIKQLESIRNVIGLGLAEFAKSLGISRQRYFDITKDGAKLETIQKYLVIARKLQEKHTRKKK